MVSILGLILRLLRARFAQIFAFLGKLYVVLAAYRGFRWTVKSFVLAAFVLWLPLPSWLIELPARLALIPPAAVYMLELAAFKPGFAIVIGALMIRFVARLALESLRD